MRDRIGQETLLPYQADHRLRVPFVAAGPEHNRRHLRVDVIGAQPRRDVPEVVVELTRFLLSLSNLFRQIADEKVPVRVFAVERTLGLR